MQKVIVFVLVALFVFSKLIRCIVLNTHNVLYDGVKDVLTYFLEKRWRLFGDYGIHLYISMFGHGKSLSIAHKVRKLYKRYGNSLLYVSNIKLNGIPYVELKNFNQLLKLGEEENADKHVGYIVVIDEVQALLNNRKYADFPIQLLGVLCEQRKKHICIYASCQRFFMVDKLFRSITTYVIDCNKYWRFQHNSYYDAWDYENSMNPQLVKRLKHEWWFVKDKDYDSYDTSQMVSKMNPEDFISNDETLTRLGVDDLKLDAVRKPSQALKHKRKKKR